MFLSLIFYTGDFFCDCPTGFYGKQCELDVDDCFNNECVNGARCVDGPNEYFCVCQPGKRKKYIYIYIRIRGVNFN